MLFVIFVLAAFGAIRGDEVGVTMSGESTVECGVRKGDIYILCEKHKNDFLTQGLAILDNIISQEEILSIEETYDTYMSEVVLK